MTITAKDILDKCSDSQREIVRTLDSPLMVSAGAGSGKTFTLTQRVGYAFSQQPDGSPAFLNSIDEIIAITFTTKAAEELKSRFKGQLIDMGLTEEALKVDDSWVSTIHGMCSRILKENAFVFGLDPSFELVEGAMQEALKYQALELSISQVKAHPEWTLLNKLISTQRLYKSGEFDSSDLSSNVNLLIDRVNTSPAGFKSIELSEPNEDPSHILMTLIDAATQVFQVLDADRDSLKKTDMGHLTKLEAALENANEKIQLFEGASFTDPDFNAEEFASVVYLFPPTSEKYRKNKPDGALFDDYRQIVATMFKETEIGCDYNFARGLICLAKLYKKTYEELLGPNQLDNSLLLSKTYEALAEHPEIAQDYRNRFKLIMIDEFQDTDLLQVAIIEMLAKEDKSNICTVGDAQQSIYRFRGADVNVFNNYRKTLPEKNPSTKLCTLPDNFRSHKEVLGLVDEIFSQEQVFGDTFLQLKPKGDVNKNLHPAFQTKKRISVHLNETRSRKSTAKDGRLAAAQKIAEHFKELRDVHNVSAGDMVILFSSMKHADIYAEALAAEGFECIYTGGSIFKESAEVQIICNAISYAANPNNSEALFALLNSQLFNLSGACLLSITSAGKTIERDGFEQAKLVTGFTQMELPNPSLSNQENRSISHAKQCLQVFLQDARVLSIADAIKNLITNSGLFARFQNQGAEGLASAGNALKALEFLADCEAGSTGLATLALTYCAYIDGIKETPGVLSTTESNYVRLMTIHASKGLQFPHVAVAEMGIRTPSDNALAIENIQETLHMYFKSGLETIDRSLSNKVNGWFDSEFEGDDKEVIKAANAGDAAAKKDALYAYVKAQELKEKQRLFYVALTRAVESLCISLAYEGQKEFDYEKKPIVKDLYGALKWEASETAPVQVVSFGDYKADLTLTVITEPFQGKTVEEPEELFVLPEPTPEGQIAQHGINAKMLKLQPHFTFRPERNGMFSYSALPHQESAASEQQDAFSCREGAPNSQEGIFDSHDGILSEQSNSLPCPNDRLPYPEAAVYAPYRATETCFDDEEIYNDCFNEPFFDEDFLSGGDVAVALGSAFHRVAQYAIEVARQINSDELLMPNQTVINAQAKQWGISPEQRLRLDAALAYWFNCETAATFAAHSELAAEIPFLVSFTKAEIEETAPEIVAKIIDAGLTVPERIFLEGEIDGLATNDNLAAYLIDYKTGGHEDETPEQLHERHVLQATCYAYALLTQGFTSVSANFVRVEQQGVVPYAFTSADLPALKQTIITAYLNGVLNHE